MKVGLGDVGLYEDGATAAAGSICALYWRHATIWPQKKINCLKETLIGSKQKYSLAVQHSYSSMYGNLNMKKAVWI